MVDKDAPNVKSYVLPGIRYIAGIRLFLPKNSKGTREDPKGVGGSMPALPHAPIAEYLFGQNDDPLGVAVFYTSRGMENALVLVERCCRILRC